MNLIEKATIIHYHRNRTKNHSQAVQALGWTEEQSQIKRFDAITELAILMLA